MLSTKQKIRSNKTLESYRYFPYLAWTLIILSSLFVIKLTLNLKDAVIDLQHKTQQLESTINTKIK